LKVISVRKLCRHEKNSRQKGIKLKKTANKESPGQVRLQPRGEKGG